MMAAEGRYVAADPARDCTFLPSQSRSYTCLRSRRGILLR
jgi:hypothetical protein